MIWAENPTLRNVQQQLRSAVGEISDANGGPLTNLTQIGITTGDDGHLSFDATVLNDKLKTNPTDVRALLYGKTDGQTGVFQAIYATSNTFGDSITGTVQSHDSQTQRLLITARQKSVDELNNLECSQRGANAYLSEQKKVWRMIEAFKQKVVD